MDMDIDLVAEDRCGGEGSGAERDSEEKLVFFYLSRKRKSPFNKHRSGSGSRSGSGFGCSTTPEPKERKSEWGEEESLEERRQKLKSADKRLESGVLSVEGNCDCWVIPRNGGAAERRSLPYRPSAFLFRPSFVPNHRYNPNVRYLGTSIDSLPLGSDGCDSDWDSHLVTPDDHMTHIPSSPVLPLFSLITLRPPEVVVNGVPEIRPDEVFGISFSLPINPPHSHLIPSIDHPLPTFPTTLFDLAIIGSCNGLYCLRSTLLDEESEEYEWFSDELVSVIVWNPTTGLSRQLPTYRHPPHNIDCHDGLVFGFGYDPSTEDYKVVKIDVDTRLVEVFSLYSNSNSWKTVQGLPKRISNIQRFFSNGAVSFEGCLNWPGSSGGSGVASFNLATETFRFLPLPFVINDLICLSLCVLDGYFSFVSLHDISLDSIWCNSVLDVWIMRKYDDNSSWTNVASIVFPHCIYTPYRILYLSKDVLILAMNGSRPLVFNLKENSLVCPHICGATYHYRGFEPYVQSNVSPNCREE